MPTPLIGRRPFGENLPTALKDPIYQKTPRLKPVIQSAYEPVVFKYPEDPKLDYIKRAVGLPGDKITYDPAGERGDEIVPRRSPVSVRNALPVTYPTLSRAFRTDLPAVTAEQPPAVLSAFR